jgi:NAD(P)-dependent dehydrogenase (short-subunit alcohol dehydrogenase family)
MCQLMHPLLKAAGSSSIVFNSSVAGVVAIRSGTLYSATKGAMNQLTKNLACEWAQDGIRCNTVAPWYVPACPHRDTYLYLYRYDSQLFHRRATRLMGSSGAAALRGGTI